MSLRRHIPELAIEWLRQCPQDQWRRLDGTLCFADISGFTKLAERLAQRGREGGEELVETLSRVFATMLDKVHDRNGVLLKFGGDALLLFFQGDDHPLQAASAAVEMRAALREAAKIPTSVGPLKLSMSVGLHSGAIDFFLVGSAHRELALLGPGANAVVATEGSAKSGQILLSDACAELLPGDGVGRRDDGWALLKWRSAKQPLPASRQPVAADDVLLQGLFPRELGDFLAAGPPDPEHRVACIAFARVSGTDAYLADHGPEALASALNTVVATAQQALEKERCTLLALDVDTDGCKLFMGGGVPYGLEDDEGSMLRAMEAFVGSPLPLPVQVGINRGHVFAAEVGSVSRAAYSAMGDTTNTAARIASKAPPGQIYAHPAVLDESLTVFEVTPTPPLKMKGKSAPLVAYQIGAMTGVRRREGLEVEDFVGRARELELVVWRIRGLANGGGGAFSLEGESGLGKTRLIEEALARAGAKPDLWIIPEPSNATRQYRAVRDPLRELLGVTSGNAQQMRSALEACIDAHAPHLAPLVSLVGEALHLELPESPVVQQIDPQFRPARLADAVIELIDAAAPGPRVFFVDDAHWCDEASAVLLGHLARAAQDRAWLVLAARREIPGGFDLDDKLTIGAMASDDVTRLIEIATEAAPLRRHEVEALVDKASGNPLFAIEILRAAREGVSIDALPQSLEAAVAVQIDALDRVARRLLRNAAVLGRSFPEDLLEKVLAAEGRSLDPVVLDRLETYLERDGDRIRFRNGVVRDTTYESMSYRRRIKVHRLAAQCIEGMSNDREQVADTLAIHYSNAREYEATWRFARLAAAAAREVYANADAVKQYELALAAAREVDGIAAEDHADVWRLLGETRELLGQFDGSVEAYKRGLALTRRNPLKRAELLFMRAVTKGRLARLSQTLRDLTLAEKCLDGDPSAAADRLRARISTERASALLHQDKPDRAREVANQAQSLAEATGEHDSQGEALMILAMSNLMLDGPDDGRHFRRAIDVFAGVGNTRMEATARTNLGVVFAMSGQWDDAVSELGAAVDQSKAIGDSVGAAHTALNLGEMLVKQRRFDEAEPVLVQAIRTMRGAGYEEGIASGQIQLAQVLQSRGEMEAADSMLQAAREVFERSGRHLRCLEVAAVRAAEFVERAQPEAALALLDEAMGPAGEEAATLQAVVAYPKALALAAVDQTDAALAELEAGIAAAAEYGLPYEEAMLRAARGEISGGAADPADASTSAEIFERLGVT